MVTEEGTFNTFGVEFVPFCSRMFFPNEMTSNYASPEDLRDKHTDVIDLQQLESKRKAKQEQEDLHPTIA